MSWHRDEAHFYRLTEDGVISVPLDKSLNVWVNDDGTVSRVEDPTDLIRGCTFFSSAILDDQGEEWKQ